MRTIDEWTRLLADLTARYQRLDAAMDAAIAAGCLDIEGELHNAAYNVLDGWIKQLGDESGAEWVSWWIYDNECGKKGLVAGYDGKCRPIRTVKQMARLIV